MSDIGEPILLTPQEEDIGEPVLMSDSLNRTGPDFAFDMVKPLVSKQLYDKTKNAVSLAATHDIDKATAYDLHDSLIKHHQEPNIYDKAVGSFKAGWGDVYSSIGGIMKRKGILPDIADSYLEVGEKFKNAYIPPTDKSEFTWRKMLDPEWYATTATRSVPFMMSLIPAAVLGAYGGAAVGGAAGLGAFGTTVAGAIGGASLSRPIESAFEAQGAYEEAKQKNMTEEESEAAANQVFWDNMKLAGLDATEFATAFLPMGKIAGGTVKRALGRRVLAATGKLGAVGLMESGEERYQEKAVMDAVGDPVSFFDFNNPRMNEAGAAGAIFGIGLAGSGSVFTALQNKVTTNMPEGSKQVYDAAKGKGLSDIQALDAVAETPEGKAHVENVIGDMKDLVEGREQKVRPEATESKTTMAKNESTIILGTNEDAQGNPISFELADPTTGETFTVSAQATEEKDGKTKYIANQEEITAEMNRIRTEKEDTSIDTTLDNLIQGENDIDTEIDRLFASGEVSQEGVNNLSQDTGKVEQEATGEAQNSILDNIKQINDMIGEKGAIDFESSKTPLVDIGKTIWNEGAISLEQFTTRSKEILGATWDKVKDFITQIWEQVKTINEKLGERGSVSTKKKSLWKIVEDRGSIDPDKLKLNREWNEDVIENGLLGLTKTGGLGLDKMAAEMQSAGDIGPTPNEYATPADYLLSLLRDEGKGVKQVKKETQATKQQQDKELSDLYMDKEAYKEGQKVGAKKERARSKEDIEDTKMKLETQYKEQIAKALKEARTSYINGHMAEAIELKKQAAEALEKLNWMKDRREKIKTFRDFFGLSDDDLKKITRKNPLLMDDTEFHEFAQEIEARALEFNENRQAKLELLQLIQEKRLQKVENYRKAMQLPTIDKMTTGQLRAFAAELEPFKNDDTFLTQRELELVDRSKVLNGVRTWREARETLAKEAGVPIETLDATTVHWVDRFRWDTALVDQNPWYNVMVRKTVSALFGAQNRTHTTETKAFELAKKADKSRSRTVMDRLIPQDKQIMEYLEADASDKQAIANGMTDEQLDYAHFIQSYFSNALDYLLQTKSVEKGRQNYFVHIRKSFLEDFKDNGLVKAVKDLFINYEQDAMVFNILDDDTGNILPLEKFFQFSLRRTGGLDPTQNVTRSFLTYVRTFEKKVALDAIMPELDIYVQSLTPTKYTPRGLEIDRSLKKFMNQYINNKKGRQISFDSVIKQGGPVDFGIRSLRMFTTMLDLGLNIPVGIASFVGEQVATFEMLGTKAYTLGNSRMFTKEGKAILDKYESFTDRSLFEKFTEPGKEITGRLSTALFGLFHQSNVTANKQFLLGSLTDAEMKAGEISPERLTELRLEMGRFRAVPGDTSLIGSTSVGNAVMQYKGWAVPIARTLTQDSVKLVKDLKNKPFWEALTTKEAKEIYRFIGLSSAAIIVYAMADGDDKKDNSFLGKLKSKAIRESMTLMQGIDPGFWLSTPRMAIWIAKLGQNLHSLIVLEHYKTKPGLKGIGGLQQQFTPGPLRGMDNNKGGRK